MHHACTALRHDLTMGRQHRDDGDYQQSTFAVSSAHRDHTGAAMGIDDRPPTPKYLSHAVRVLEVSILVVMAAWVFGPLHGVRITPKKVTAEHRCVGFRQTFTCQSFC